MAVRGGALQREVLGRIRTGEGDYLYSQPSLNSSHASPKYQFN